MKIHQDTQFYQRMMNRCLVMLLVLLFTVILGTMSYRFIEKWSWFDAFYMTVITIASVGYGETHELSTAGRTFTSLLIFIGVTVIAGWFAVITSLLLDTDLEIILGGRK